jgi:TIGR00730 family protein
MSRRSRRRKPGHLFHTSAEDRQYARREVKTLESTPQLESPAYRLAFDDEDFLTREELRGVRLMLELTKPELELQAAGINHTVVIFGSARTPSPEQLAANEARLAQVERDRPGSVELVVLRQRVNMLRQQNRYYNEARRLARFVTERSGCESCPKLTVVTGGGPGIMEAANRGAAEAGGESIGLNIVLPHEQAPNTYITPRFCFQFHYFAMRKMHFLLRARALVAFPGGFGTMDELFEALTLVQTGKIEPLPVLIFGKEFWESTINFNYLVEQGVISANDLDLFRYVETAEQAWEIISESLSED